MSRAEQSLNRAETPSMRAAPPQKMLLLKDSHPNPMKSSRMETTSDKGRMQVSHTPIRKKRNPGYFPMDSSFLFFIA